MLFPTSFCIISYNITLSWRSYWPTWIYMGGGVNQAYSRLSTTLGHITDCKLDSVVYACVCVWVTVDLSCLDRTTYARQLLGAKPPLQWIYIGIAIEEERFPSEGLCQSTDFSPYMYIVLMFLTLRFNFFLCWYNCMLLVINSFYVLVHDISHCNPRFWWGSHFHPVLYINVICNMFTDMIWGWHTCYLSVWCCKISDCLALQ